MGWIDQFSADKQGTLEFQIMRPARHLRPWVAYYWALKCDNSVPIVEEYLCPDGLEEIIFSFGGAYKRRRCGESSEQQRLTNSYIVGAKDTGLLCSRESSLKMVGVKLHPQSLYQLFAVPLNTFFNTPLSLDDIDEPRLLALEEKLFHAPDLGAITQALDHEISMMLVHSPSSDLNTEPRFEPRTEHAIKRINEARGGLSIDALLTETNCHYRTLERIFQRRVGQGPKSYARNIRFKHAMLCLNNTIANNKKFFASDLGYYDQSHFNKDFRFYTGESPRGFIQHESARSTEVFTLSNQHSL